MRLLIISNNDVAHAVDVTVQERLPSGVDQALVKRRVDRAMTIRGKGVEDVGDKPRVGP
jgi:hypothetical protein